MMHDHLSWPLETLICGGVNATGHKTAGQGQCQKKYGHSPSEGVPSIVREKNQN